MSSIHAHHEKLQSVTVLTPLMGQKFGTWKMKNTSLKRRVFIVTVPN